MRKRLIVCLLAVTVLIGGASFFGKQESVKTDYAVAAGIKEMTETSANIVEGHFREFKGTWNMARDNFDTKKESKEYYTEGLLYEFVIDEVYKGNLKKGEVITVIHRHSDTYSGETVIDENYFEIEKEEEYILFLEYNDIFEHYYGSFQPWAIEIVNDKAVLKGNLPELHKDFHDEITGLKHVDLVKKLK